MQIPHGSSDIAASAQRLALLGGHRSGMPDCSTYAEFAEASPVLFQGVWDPTALVVPENRSLLAAGAAKKAAAFAGDTAGGPAAAAPGLPGQFLDGLGAVGLVALMVCALAAMWWCSVQGRRERPGFLQQGHATLDR